MNVVKVMNIALIAVLILTAELLARSNPSHDLIVKWRTLPSRLDAEIFSSEFADNVVSLRAALPQAPHTVHGLDRIIIVEMTDDISVQALSNYLQTDSRIEYAEPRQIRHTQARTQAWNSATIDGVPNDPFYPQQWALEKVQAPLAWDITRGSPNVVIAVVDLGVAFAHPELTNQQWTNGSERIGQPGVDDDNNGYIDDIYGYDFVDRDGDPTPSPLTAEESHGTHVAGIAAAERNNGRGISGLAPDCKIMAIRAGAGSRISYGYEGIYYACRTGAKIINCSWGGLSDSGFERDVIQFAIDHDCIVVASAGNDLDRELPLFPAGIEGVISVAATDWADRATIFTHFGSWVKISAPGDDIISTVIVGDGQFGYDTWQGTSMSAPYVAAALALVASAFSTLSASEISARILSSADNIDLVNPNYVGQLGLGRLNALTALTDSLQGVHLDTWSLHETVGNLDNRIAPGESAELIISAIADLHDLGGLRVEMSVEIDSLIITSHTAFWDFMPRGSSQASLSPLRFQLPQGVRRARVIPLNLNFTSLAGDLLGRATLPLIIDSTFVVLENESMQLGFAENGSLGYEKYPDSFYLGPGLSLSRDRPIGALHHGSFVLAVDGQVSDNFYGDANLRREDWIALPDSFAHRISNGRGAMETRSVFSDRGSAENELFARVTANGLAYSGGAADQFLILEYKIENRSINRWTETYAGLAMDWDLGAATTNLSTFDAASSIAYVSTLSPGYPLVGVVSLTGDISSYSVINNRAEIDPINAWTDSIKWQRISSGLNSSPPERMDLSQMIAVGPFSLPANSDTTTAFALIWGQSEAELRALADSARTRYGTSRAAISPAEVAQTSVTLSPNPIPASGELTIQIPGISQVDFTLYNLLGQTVFSRKSMRLNRGIAKIDLSDLSAVSGILFYNIQYGDYNKFGKLLMIR